jgi:hypothetical protein
LHHLGLRPEIQIDSRYGGFCDSRRRLKVIQLNVDRVFKPQKPGKANSRRENIMPISRRTLIATLGLSSVANLLPRSAFAAYPDRPIHLIVPFAPGGNADIVGRIVGRIVGEQMSQALGQPVVVDNRGGVGGSIGAEIVARATPDGYMLLVGSNGPLTVNPFVQAKIG